MTTIDIIFRYNRIHKLIKNRATGSPKILSEKLNICESMLYNDIREMRFKGAPIFYDKNCKTYYYSEDGDFSIENGWNKNILP